ncbi:MAG: hypothetical protein BGN85_02135 [Alphaproteobacteria bacterium 64-11]|nr:hypothetical protein [Alphaproteobacteria bacterium]OJU08853.1 MAG: hypothetical protein BGN85_02135 [Alphaproteobacteria bacterium 64-11]
MLILKLTIVPLALLALGVVERLHGPRLAGWLAGIPVVAGPLLVFITLDHGAGFGAHAALGAWFGLVPWLGFANVYAFFARFAGWLWCLPLALAVWLGLAVLSGIAQEGPRWLAVVPLLAYAAAVLLNSRGPASNREREHVWWGLPARMLAGAALTLAITRFAGALGSHWSGVLTAFPVLGSIIAVSNHVQYGRHAVQEAVAGMSMGLSSVGAFCFTVYVLLPHIAMWPAFILALMASSTVHALTFLLFTKVRRPARLPQA